ncbi:MAG: KdsC family phosphatase [Chloroflexota bacterium]
MDEELNQKLGKIKLLIMDVDGTLTDSGMYYSDEGESFKRFSTRDGMGITLLHKRGLETAIITSEDTEIVLARATKLNIGHVIMGCHNKTQAFKDLVEKLKLKLEETAYIGDDVNDYHIMQLCGASACPSDAVDSIRGISDYVCSARGGYGAVREFIECILKSQNKSVLLNENW